MDDRKAIRKSNEDDEVNALMHKNEAWMRYAVTFAGETKQNNAGSLRKRKPQRMDDATEPEPRGWDRFENRSIIDEGTEGCV